MNISACLHGNRNRNLPAGRFNLSRTSIFVLEVRGDESLIREQILCTSAQADLVCMCIIHCTYIQYIDQKGKMYFSPQISEKWNIKAGKNIFVH
jgi:hypothetical protein